MQDHILIVDDEPVTVELMRLMLKTLNIAVESASTGAEAITVVEGNPPLLVILDLMLPDMSGYDVCASLKKSPTSANIPVVMLTARHDQAARDKAEGVGVNYFLTKPVTRAQLNECLQTALKDRKDNSPRHP
jgi:CheY-like chemotaxis protein